MDNFTPNNTREIAVPRFESATIILTEASGKVTTVEIRCPSVRVEEQCQIIYAKGKVIGTQRSNLTYSITDPSSSWTGANGNAGESEP